MLNVIRVFSPELGASERAENTFTFQTETDKNRVSCDSSEIEGQHDLQGSRQLSGSFGSLVPSEPPLSPQHLFSFESTLAQCWAH